MLLHEIMGLRGYQYLDMPEVRKPPEGLVASSAYLGMEFEYERTGAAWDREEFPDFARPLRKWYLAHQDGSLRGRDAVELVFRTPLRAAHAYDAMQAVVKLAGEKEWVCNKRTGFHVHLNVGNLELSQFRKLMRLYALYEPALFTAAGDQRSGSIFCIPWFRDVHLRHSVATLFRTFGGIQYARNFGKYSGLNLKPVSNFGSIEFRHLRNTTDISKLTNWVNLVLLLHKTCLRPDFEEWWSRALTHPRNALEMLYNRENMEFWRALDYPEFNTEVNRLTMDLVRELEYLDQKAEKEQPLKGEEVRLMMQPNFQDGEGPPVAAERRRIPARRGGAIIQALDLPTRVRQVTPLTAGDVFWQFPHPEVGTIARLGPVHERMWHWTRNGTYYQGVEE